MLKIFIENIIYFLIELIERIEYKNRTFDEDDPLKKIINFIQLDNLSVETDYGFVPIEEINISQPYKIYEIKLENGLKLKCADVHGVFCEGHIIKYVKDLTKEDIVITNKGNSRIKSIKKINHKVSMFDLSIGTNEHSYYTNDILSLNTVSASIVILHLVMFNDDKGVMIVANKSDTVKEIIRKIKDIYKLLPFFLKTGVTNWNEKQIAFENNSRVQSQARSKEPSIGFTIDLLYLDEFAKVPDNIIRQYYGSVIPTVSSIENSKVIITSTPDGYNLFWELLIDAERPKEDPRWNKYEAMRVYWHQVKGRRDTKLLFLEHKCRQYNITKEEVLEQLKNMGYEIYFKKLENDYWYFIKFFEDNSTTPRENCKIDEIRQIRISEVIPLPEIARITNWQEEQTNLVGGESMFKQEYEIQFITDDKLLFDSVMFESFMNEQYTFESPKLDIFDKKLILPYNSLTFVKDHPELFELDRAKDYYITIGIDLAEGLGLDYTVFNIFRLMMKDDKLIEKKKDIYSNKYDLFKMEQIGLFRNNVYSITEVAHILYLLVFEIFDPEKVKIVVEMNKNLGNDLVNNMRHVFNDNNDFMDAVFARYKHRESDQKPKIGLLIGHNKKLLLKDFQDAVKKDNIVLHNESTIIELKSFSKRETPSGEITFRSETGNDDCVMSMINLSSLFDNNYYKNMVDTYSDYNITEKDKQTIINFLKIKDDGSLVDFQSFTGAHKRFYPKVKPDIKPIPFLSPFNQKAGDLRNPFEKKW
jgi:hypothetical protein